MIGGIVGTIIILLMYWAALLVYSILAFLFEETHKIFVPSYWREVQQRQRKAAKALVQRRAYEEKRRLKGLEWDAMNPKPIHDICQLPCCKSTWMEDTLRYQSEDRRHDDQRP